MKTYILQKDLPNVPKGTELTWNSTKTWSGGELKGGRYGVWDMPSEKSCTVIFTTEDVENNPVWFRLKEEQEYELSKEICHCISFLNTNGYSVIEGSVSEKKYTVEDMRKCFVAAREIKYHNIPYQFPLQMSADFITFEYYLKSLNK